ncbi:MAG: hypothetical protein PHQ27_03560 [Victivallales bacterium]|nr:hypothetical protein [Victivallales bacterium]
MRFPLYILDAFKIHGGDGDANYRMIFQPEIAPAGSETGNDGAGHAKRPFKTAKAVAIPTVPTLFPTGIQISPGEFYQVCCLPGG